MEGGEDGEVVIVLQRKRLGGVRERARGGSGNEREKKGQDRIGWDRADRKERKGKERAKIK